MFFNHLVVFSPLGYLYSESGIYYCPESVICSSLAKYRSFIDGLPVTEEPEIFGMHENANIPYQVSWGIRILSMFFALIKCYAM